MIPANELKQGNVVLHHGEKMIVEELIEIEKTHYDLDGVQVRLLYPNGSDYDKVVTRSTGDLDPLPISSDTLSATAFDKIDTTVYNLLGFTVKLDDKTSKTTFTFENRQAEEIRGFHKLQNYFKSLTKMSLTYKFD